MTGTEQQFTIALRYRNLLTRTLDAIRLAHIDAEIVVVSRDNDPLVCSPPYLERPLGVGHEFRAAACGVETPPQVSQVVCPRTDRIDVVESKPTFYMFNGR
ncbi:MAG: hypothetical protein OXG26_16995 [Caldilineaceae bacterium]|nr:hypothetical protein [Caldilineaceae bacterium]